MSKATRIKQWPTRNDAQRQAILEAESMLEALTEEVTGEASALAKSVSGRDKLPVDAVGLELHSSV